MLTIFHEPKKVVIFMFVVLGAGGGILFVYNRSRPQKPALPVVYAVASPAGTEQPNLDSDGDGLKDWEETLWKTDPHNPDTDGDGMNDGDEIKAGRDPLAKGDKPLKPAAPSLDNFALLDSAPTEPKTLTEKMAKSFSDIYLSGKNQNEDITAIQQELLGSLDGAMNTASQDPAVFYSEKDIIVSPDASSAATKKYAETLGVIFTEEFKNKNLRQNELALLLETLTAFNADAAKADGFRAFAAYAAGYDRAAERMQKVPVPAPYASYHVMLMNSFRNLADIDRRFAEIPRDPAIGALAISDYRAVSVTANQALAVLSPARP